LPEALAPFRIPQPARPEGDPEPLAYLVDPADQRQGAYDLTLKILLVTPGLKEKGLPPHRLALSSTRHLYWTVAQLLAHHASGGCNLQPGDLFGTGTISGPDEQSCGSLLETTNGGRKPVELASGETRRFLENGDEVILRAYAEREGYARIGFGECRATILGAAR
jgi:fumarylacetoacetase